MNLKKILSALCCFVVLSGMASCGDKDTPKEPVSLKGVNNIETTGLSVNATDIEAKFSVYSPVTPSITTDQTWVRGEASEPSLMNSISQVVLTIEPNNTTESRKANVTVSASGASLIVTITQAAGEAVEEPEPETPSTGDVDQELLGLKALDIAKDIRNGWNIGNTLEVPGNETGWGNPKINATYVAGIKAAGFNAVRIPCAWDSYIIDKSSNTIDPSWLNRVNEVVGMVLDEGMYAIINIHWDGGWLENKIGTAAKPELLEKQKTLWTQIAGRLGHYNERLMFAGLNEPNADDKAGAAALLEYEQAFIDAVRSTGGNNSKRTLIFQGPNTDISKTFENFTVNPVDPAGEGYLMAEIHYYDPYQYTIMEGDESWGKVFWFWGNGFHQSGSQRNATWGEEDWMKDQFDKMKKQFVDKNIPVIVGEYGAYPQEEKHYANLQTEEEKEIVAKSRAYFYNCVQKFAKERGLIPFVWDTGELINRNNGQVTKQYMIDAILEGSESVSYPY